MSTCGSSSTSRQPDIDRQVAIYFWASSTIGDGPAKCFFIKLFRAIILVAMVVVLTLNNLHSFVASKSMLRLLKQKKPVNNIKITKQILNCWGQSPMYSFGSKKIQVPRMILLLLIISVQCTDVSLYSSLQHSPNLLYSKGIDSHAAAIPLLKVV